MNIFDEYTKSLLIVFNKHKVEYLVVGGYAVNFYGYRRTTGDIDLWLKPDNLSNRKKIVDSFAELGITKETLKQIEELDFTKPLVFMDGEEPFKIDFMTFISGVGFDEAWKEKRIESIDDVLIPFIHLNHLIVSKIASGREKDKLDVTQLQEIQQLKHKK